MTDQNEIDFAPGRPRFSYHPEEEVAVHKLPFVTINPQAEDPLRRVDWFDVPITGDYEADNEIGRQCAAAYLRFLRSRPQEDSCHLQHIVLSLLPRDHPKHGAIVGFFWLLDKWLHWVAVNAGSCLDGVSEDEIESAVNELLDRAKSLATNLEGGSHEQN